MQEGTEMLFQVGNSKKIHIRKYLIYLHISWGPCTFMFKSFSSIAQEETLPGKKSTNTNVRGLCPNSLYVWHADKFSIIKRKELVPKFFPL